MFWLCGATPARFENSLRDCVRLAEIPGRDDPKANIFLLFIEWLRGATTSTRRWLIVLDDFDDGRSPAGWRLERGFFFDLFVVSDDGAVILTSRHLETALRFVKRDVIIDLDKILEKTAEIDETMKVDDDEMANADNDETTKEWNAPLSSHVLESFHDSGLGTSIGMSNARKDGDLSAMMETMSIRSVRSTIRLDNEVIRNLTDDFLERLMCDVKKHLKSTDALDDLSNLLRDFTILLRTASPSGIPREAAKFVRQRREHIAYRFKRDAEDLLPLEPSKEITSQDRMDLLFNRGDHGDTDQALDTDGDLAEDVSDDDDVESRDHTETKEFAKVREFLFNSEEFHWLADRVKLLTSNDITGSTYSMVRSAVACQIEQLPLGSELSISLEWQPLEYLNSQFPTASGDLARSLTYIGNVEAAYASSALEYASSIWPRVGNDTISCIQKACMSSNRTARIIIHDTALKVALHPMHTSVSLIGSPKEILEIAEVCIWLATACRASQDMDDVESCVPQLQTGSQLDSKSPYHIRMEARYQPLIDTQRVAVGSCWLKMVRNPIIAYGYPIPLRQEDDHKGLETSVDIMVALSGANYATTFRDKFLLKGFQSALVPVTEDDASIVWHFLVSEDPKHRLTYNTACDAAAVSSVTYSELSMAPRRRNFVGVWTPSARIAAGSADKTLYDLHQSQSSPITHLTGTLSGGTIGVGQYITVGATFLIGRKDASLRAASANNFEFQLELAEPRSVLFYGDQDKRGWLLDGTSAILHLTIAWLFAKGFDSHVSKFRFGDAVVGRPSSGDRLLVNRNLPIFTKAESPGLDLTQSVESGDRSNSTPAESGYFSGSVSSQELNVKQERRESVPSWTCEELARHFLLIMETIVDKQASDSLRGPQIDVRVPSKVPLLEGWEAHDIVLQKTRNGK